MIIKNLDQMEKIVKSNKNLEWFGWDVAERKRSEHGRTSVGGIRIDGNWYIQKVFKLTGQGWNIPNKYGE